MTGSPETFPKTSPKNPSDIAADRVADFTPDPIRARHPDSAAGCRSAERVARIIIRMINQGFTADATVTHFIDSTFNCPDTPAIKALLADTGNDDVDGLMALVLSPDQTHFLEMEEFLENSGYNNIDEETVRSFFPDRFESALYFSDQRSAACFSVKKALVGQFLSFFRLSDGIDPGLSDSLKCRLPEKTSRLQALVAIRQSRVMAADQKQLLINHLVQYIEVSGHLLETDFFSGLDILLALFRHPTAADDLLTTLAAEKTRCCRQLEQSRYSEKQLAAKNIETLMLQGQRGLLMIDEQAMQAKINTLDMLGRMLFGQHPAASLGAPEMPLAFSFEKDSGR